MQTNDTETLMVTLIIVLVLAIFVMGTLLIILAATRKKSGVDKQTLRDQILEGNDSQSFQAPGTYRRPQHPVVVGLVSNTIFALIVAIVVFLSTWKAIDEHGHSPLEYFICDFLSLELSMCAVDNAGSVSPPIIVIERPEKPQQAPERLEEMPSEQSDGLLQDSWPPLPVAPPLPQPIMPDTYLDSPDPDADYEVPFYEHGYTTPTDEDCGPIDFDPKRDR
ncbi:hypothetical protein [Erythrobacter crassostreae]|uniref:Uncharacterized protein n=1 Tax=Erythrobacter crassostreae TaxID=2828328 RepID=A0A9X1JL80_9SPHN|nr:hypothetical protein [Erythrobacter crassostrea]MBV7258054.1 hypothetical protein [Erythrobacter crassostrea]